MNGKSERCAGGISVMEGLHRPSAIWRSETQLSEQEGARRQGFAPHACPFAFQVEGQLSDSPQMWWGVKCSSSDRVTSAAPVSLKKKRTLISLGHCYRNKNVYSFQDPRRIETTAELGKPEKTSSHHLAFPNIWVWERRYRLCEWKWDFYVRSFLEETTPNLYTDDSLWGFYSGRSNFIHTPTTITFKPLLKTTSS